jgi:hypothetical protein
MMIVPTASKTKSDVGSIVVVHQFFDRHDRLHVSAGPARFPAWRSRAQERKTVMNTPP